jgi:anti-sigma regulatory factor (Ser/Thr protein kinase)
MLADHADRDVAALLVSELATNAVCHAQTSFVVVISVLENVHVEVRDGSTLPPQLRAKDPRAEAGRGLALVNELALAWGYQPTAEGKTVWFETGVNHFQPNPDAPPPTPRGARSARFRD